MENELEKLANDWISAAPDEVDVKSGYYCGTRDVFEGRNDRMPDELISKGLDESLAYLVYAISGELGNNSFDHNIGNWPDIMGIFFAYDYDGRQGSLIIVDRGIGILNSLRNALPDLKSDRDALETAFTKKISSRVLENRGNGLKFIKNNVSEKKLFLRFFSGDARVEINHDMKISENSQLIKGCLAILKF